MNAAAADARDVLAAIDERIARRSILEHPFYRAWNAGTLTREDLARYAETYYPHVAAFPGYLERALANATGADREELAANLAEERAVPAPHPELWLDFAAAMGADRERVAAADPSFLTAATVATFEALCGGSTGCAAAALYAYESQQPAVSATKLRGLRELYGVTDEAATAYFAVHADADVRHREGEREVLVRALENGEDPEALFASTDRALDAYWQLLDGVVARLPHPIAC